MQLNSFQKAIFVISLSLCSAQLLAFPEKYNFETNKRDSKIENFSIHPSFVVIVVVEMELAYMSKVEMMRNIVRVIDGERVRERVNLFEWETIKASKCFISATNDVIEN